MMTTPITRYRYAVELENGSEVVADSWPELLDIFRAIGYDGARIGTPAPDEWVYFDAEWTDGAGVVHSVNVEGVGPDYAAPEYDEPATAHGFDVCPSCGDAGVKMTPDGYAPCTRFLSCWSDSADDAGAGD